MNLRGVTRFKNLLRERVLTRAFERNGMIPWTRGYNEYKWREIKRSLEVPGRFKSVPKGYGFRIDERIVEYPWVLSRVESSLGRVLDAGSSFNHIQVAEPLLERCRELTICTLTPESNSLPSNGVSYVYSDLRSTPFEDACFDSVLSVSTIEHIDMDNSMYGYKGPHNPGKSFAYLEALSEFIRILRNEGRLLVTVPFGRYEHHGFFQQFDKEMYQRAADLLGDHGEIVSVDFYKYKKDGWEYSTLEDCRDARSHNPHTGVGREDDLAAHCRSVACIEFVRKC